MIPPSIPPPGQTKIAPIEPSIFDDDDEGWQDMPIIRDGDDFANGLDEEDQKRYHYIPQAKKDKALGASNATGNVLDIDYEGAEWRSKVDQNESEYTRVRLVEEDDQDEVHLRTRYLFDEDKAMTPLSQMQATKNLLTEAQRIAYVGLCSLTCREMADRMKAANQKELNQAIKNMQLWSLKIMGRLYYHMELATEEQKMIETLGNHGIEPKDLVPPLMTTHTVANPEYDPAEARKQAEIREAEASLKLSELAEDDSADISDGSRPSPLPDVNTTPKSDTSAKSGDQQPVQTTVRVLEDTSEAMMPGVSTHLSAADENVTLDIRWTVLCDLFLILIADSVYDARSRVLLENVALKLGLGWLDLVKFERRVTEALEIQEDLEKLEQAAVIEDVKKNSKKRRYMMLGLATLGGGLVIGLSAGLLAPVIGAGLGAALTTIGITGTTGFLAGAGGAAVITTGGVLTGSGIAAKGMARRTQFVRTFDILPLHNNKRVNCILTVPGFMNGKLDDVRLPFSVLDPVVGDVFSVLWEPEMIQETGSALRILTGEVLTQIGQTVLQATVMTALMSALQWPIILTKLGYLIDNPWSNALDRAKSAGSVLADVLIQRHLGVRPISLIGFSLGSRVIFYALLELAKQKAFGIVQDVVILGTTVTAPTKTWLLARSVVSGRFVNGYARNDWVLNYLFRATSGGLNTVAGLRAIPNVPGLENVDVTDKIAGHMSYRTFMPLILDQLGFPVSADYFDEPVEPDFEGDRVVVKEGEEDNKRKSWFGLKKKKPTPATPVSRPPTASSFPSHRRTGSSASTSSVADEDLPPREATLSAASVPQSREATPEPSGEITDALEPSVPKTAGFDLRAIKEAIGNAERNPAELQMPAPTRYAIPPIPPPTLRSESAPPPIPESPHETPKVRSSFDLPSLAERAEPSSGQSSGSSSRNDLSSTLARSMSLNDMRAESENEPSSSSEKTPSYSAFQTSSSRPPALSFNGSEISAWPGESEPTPSFSGNPYAGAFGHSPFGFGSSNNSLRPFDSYGGFGSYGNSVASNTYSAPDSASLSFGTVDGAISFSPSLAVPARDPWDIGSSSFGSSSNTNPKKSPSTLNLNPWQS